jgi:hypothetical protein
MPPCYCKYNRCNGADVHRNVRLDHQRHDQRVALDITLGLRAPPTAPASSTTAPPSARSGPSSRAVSPSLDPQGLPPPAAPSPSNVNTDLSLPTQPSSPSSSNEELEREAAEERGRVHVERFASAVTIDDDIGDLREDEEMDDREDGEPATHEVSPPEGPSLSSRPGLPLHSPPSADPRHPGENEPDPFYVPPSAVSTPSITSASTSTPLYILYLLVAWLHTQCKLAFTACGAVLVVVAHILAAANVPFGERPAYTTLTSVMTNLNIEPAFQVLPLCPRCMEPYPANRDTSSVCDECANPLFAHIKRHDRRHAHAEDIARPLLQCPFMSIEQQLRTLLEVPGMEDELEQWRHVPRTPGKYHDMFDGRVPQEIKGPDEQPFFENPLPPDSTELRIGLVLGFDW